jgi:hypothetical protein
MNNYYNKYLKYKNKYNTLKIKIGGMEILNSEKYNKMIGLECEYDKIKYLNLNNPFNKKEEGHDDILNITCKNNIEEKTVCTYGDIQKKGNDYNIKTKDGDVDLNNYNIYKVDLKNPTKKNLLYICDKNDILIPIPKPPQHILRIHLFKKTLKQPRENLKTDIDGILLVPQFKFDEMNDWHHVKEVFDESVINYNDTWYDCDGYNWISNCYSKQRFQLVTFDEYEKVINKLQKKYNNYYNNASKWMEYMPKLNEYFKRDNCIIDKVNILNGKIFIVGDFHSSFHSLYYILEKLRDDNFFENNTMILKKDKYMIFLGDIIDRGPYSLDLLFVILCLKNLNFNNVHIINGNHEDKKIYEDSSPQARTGPEMVTQLNKLYAFMDEKGKIIPNHSKGVMHNIIDLSGNDEPILKVGRDPNSDISFDESCPSISRLHAQIFKKVKKIYWYDESKFGTKIYRNGQLHKELIKGEYNIYENEILPGDEFILGTEGKKIKFNKIDNDYLINNELYLEMNSFTSSIFHKILYFLPSCIYLTFNNKLYHLSHGAFDEGYAKEELNKFLSNESKKFDIVKTTDHSSNQYKWGDFSNKILGIKSDYESGRNIYGLNATKEYLEKHGITMCITGHQDYTPIAFLLDKSKLENLSSDNDFKNSLINDKMYNDEYGLKSLSEAWDDDQKDKEHFIVIDKNNPIVALVTSTAIISKKLKKNCYLTLGM